MLSASFLMLIGNLKPGSGRKHIGAGGLFIVSVVLFVLAATLAGGAFASDKKHDMRGMDMSCMADMNGVDMSAMGPSMAAIECHMYVTPLRPSQPGDEKRRRRWLRR